MQSENVEERPSMLASRDWQTAFRGPDELSQLASPAHTTPSASSVLRCVARAEKWRHRLLGSAAAMAADLHVDIKILKAIFSSVVRWLQPILPVPWYSV